MVAKTEHHLRSGCPVACALDIIGDHWSLLVIRDLMFLGRHEYKDMLAGEEGISSNILSDRLAKLEQSGLVSSASHPLSKRRKLYFLTERGKDLVFVLLELSRWSDRHLGERIFIPADRRPLLEMKTEAVAELVRGHLAQWEAENLPRRPTGTD